MNPVFCGHVNVDPHAGGDLRPGLDSRSVWRDKAKVDVAAGVRQADRQRAFEPYFTFRMLCRQLVCDRVSKFEPLRSGGVHA
ncbi:MAG TPA: hypothetical protein DGG94_02990 [Micromonosporaceae bacterium]|nr:hypothetical protein [Micromonosporaceae bacterium]HCU48783.1 hypothetical protein [Micromonosporaceae bacterium]